MNEQQFILAGKELVALATGALFWAEQRLLCVSDLHLGKAERIARRSGLTLPPYETRDTLDRLDAALELTQAETVVCLGDSFDDLRAAHSLPDEAWLHITRLQAGRRWIWIEGNHDPGPVECGGTHMAELVLDGLTFRHIAQTGAMGEISGHYHPKAHIRTRAKTVTRPAFLHDEVRVILPAFGTYTGGLASHDPAFDGLFGSDARAILIGRQAHSVPMPRAAAPTGAQRQR